MMEFDINAVIASKMQDLSSLDIDVKIERDNNNVPLPHLTDHDYFTSRGSPNRSKKPKKKLKIRELKAIYNCITCGYRTMNRETLKEHSCLKNVDFMLDTNAKVKLPTSFTRCPKCNFCTKNIDNLKLHLATHIEGVRQKCTDCDISNNYIDTRYKCPKCCYTTKNPTSLKVHMHIHARGNPFKCTECSYSARDLKQLIRHYDDMKDLTCKCGYTTHVKQQMLTHKRTHSGEKPFVCGVCQYATSDRGGLHRHMMKHSGTAVVTL